MIKPSSNHRAEYDRRLHRVLTYIDAHLEERIDLARLAKVAAFSAYHFHRIFAAHVGETFGAYLTRRRVEQAAARMASQPQLRVLNVALSVGFGSAEAFTRAFKKHFGRVPSVWKKQRSVPWFENSKISQANSNPSQAKGRRAVYSRTMSKIKSKPLQVSIQSRPAVRISYLRYQGPFGDAVGQFWQNEVYPWMAENNLFGVPRYGVSHDDPQVTTKNKCRYDAGVEVGPDYVPSQKAHVATVPGGLYAATQFKGTSSEIPVAWDRILREWLPASGYQLDARPCFEYYPVDGEFNEKTGVFTAALYTPIVRL